MFTFSLAHGIVCEHAVSWPRIDHYVGLPLEPRKWPCYYELFWHIQLSSTVLALGSARFLFHSEKFNLH